MSVRIGISGWKYAPWRGPFYPKGLVQKKELSYASSKVSAIEINGTFYSLQKPKSWQQWNDETPDDFKFTIKGGRYITHIRRLKDVRDPLANFFASGMLALGDKMGPFLWQFPKNVMFKDDRWQEFFKLLPKDSDDMQLLAKKHTDKVDGRAITETQSSFAVHHALDLRHKSFYCQEFLDLCHEHNVALVLSDPSTVWQENLEIPADFVYCRLHGHDEVFPNGYEDKDLKLWKKRIQAWQKGMGSSEGTPIYKGNDQHGRDVWVFFDNDQKALAPQNAMSLIQMMEKRTRGAA